MEIITIAENQCKRIKKVAISITKFSSKIYELSLYDKTVNNFIHNCKWRETIKKKLQNLERHQIWEYDKLFPKQKAIKSKWVFKVKYYLNGFITRFKIKLVAQEFFQIYEIDFSKIFVLIVRRESLWIYLALYLIFDLFIY